MSYKKYIVKSGDTIPLIAQKEMGDATQAYKIIVLNDLQYPYIDTSVDPISVNAEDYVNIRLLGDVILIPINVGDTPTDSEGQHTIDLLLDTDSFSLSGNQGGELVGNVVTGDLEIVSDLQCLKQDLINQLLTPLGSLVYHPEYGSRFLSIIGNKNDRNWVDKAIIEVTKTFRSNDRVLDVSNTQVSHRDTIYIQCSIVSIYGTFDLNYNT